ncbi:MAG: hypothetical protein ACREMW_12345 [Gemmatimonadales bacterium]
MLLQRIADFLPAADHPRAAVYPPADTILVSLGVTSTSGAPDGSTASPPIMLGCSPPAAARTPASAASKSRRNTSRSTLADV